MRTIGYHIVVSGYGLWLPGDERGHWSSAWDAQVGYIEPHMLHDGDPVRKRIAAELIRHPRVVLSNEMLEAVTETIADCHAQSDWRLAAASVEPTHTHMLMTYTARNIENTIKWLKDQMTKAVHQQTSHTGPVWCKGRWRGFIFDPIMWRNTRLYIECHNERRGLGPRPYSFVSDIPDPS